MTQQFWVGVVSKEHVLKGKEKGFAQVCHGKEAPLKRMAAGDVFVYYSPHLKFKERTPYQCFTALGIVLPRDVYQVKMNEDFYPYRRDIQYLDTQDCPIRPIISQLSFIRDKTKWGASFRFGILKIPQKDFVLIARTMSLSDEKINELLL